MRWILMPLFALVCLLGTTGCEGRGPETGWWRYGLSGSSPFWHELHLYDEDPTQDQRLVVAITVFADETTAVHHVLERDGTGMTERDGAKTAFRRTTRQVQVVDDLLARLTPGGDYPPPQRLAIVRWHRNGAWVTLRCDRGELPDGVQDIAGVVTGRPIGDVAP